MFENDNEKMMQDFQEYCGGTVTLNDFIKNAANEDKNNELTDSLAASLRGKIGDVFIVIGSVFFVMTVIVPIIIIIVMYIAGKPVSNPGALFGFICFSMFPLILGTILRYTAPKNRFDKKIKNHEKNFNTEKLLADFAQSVPKYDDAFRLGNNYIFGRGRGEFARLDTIKSINRVRHFHYVNRVLSHTEYYIDICYKNNTIFKLCYLTSQNYDDGNMWLDFRQELSRRCDSIKIISVVIDRTSYHSTTA